MKIFIKSVLSSGLVSMLVSGAVEANQVPLTPVAIRGHGVCHFTKMATFDPWYLNLAKDAGAPNQLTMVASFAGLKTLTNIFNDGGVRGEHITLALHYFFQRRLYESLFPIIDINLGKISAPYAKFIRAEIELNPESQFAFQTVTAEALDNAVADAAEYLSGGSGTASIAFRKFMQTGEDIPGFTPAFPEGMSKPKALSNTDLASVRNRLAQSYPGSKLPEALKAWYSIGVASLDVDSHLYARLRALSRQNNAILFNPSELKTHLNEIMEKRKSLAWLFEGKSPEQLYKIFTVIRKNIGLSNINEIDRDYAEILNKSGLELVLRHLQVESYIKHLNLIDYLPEEKLVGDHSAREQFSQLANPTGIGFIDLIGLGAKNLLTMHQEVPRFQKEFEDLISAIKVIQKIEQENPNDQINLARAELEARNTFERFYNSRKSLLLGTDAMIQDVRLKVIEHLRASGLSENEFVLWASGDDIFFVVNNKKIDIRDIMIRIKGDDTLGRILRTGFAYNDTNAATIPLQIARTVVGSAAAALKFLERANLDYPVVLQASFKDPNVIGAFRIADDKGGLDLLDQFTLGVLQGHFPSATILGSPSN